MALVQCPECGQQVSESASSCPKCGHSFAKKKYCNHCGAQIDEDCIICPKCGKQVGEIKNQSQPQNIIINNSASSSSSASATAVNNGIPYRKACNKWVSFLLCLFIGYLGAHKFYEGRTGMGVLYLFTMGLFGIGWFIDTFILLFKPNPYYV